MHVILPTQLNTHNLYHHTLSSIPLLHKGPYSFVSFTNNCIPNSPEESFQLTSLYTWSYLADARAPQPSLTVLLIQLPRVVCSSLACSIWGTLALPLCSVTHTPLSQPPSSPHAPVQPGWSDSAVLTTFETLSGFTS